MTEQINSPRFERIGPPANASGSAYLSTLSDESVGVDTYAKITGTDGNTTAVLLNQFSHSNGRLTYDGPRQKRIKIAVSICCKAANNAVLTYAIAINGTEQTETEMCRGIQNALDAGALALIGEFDLNPGDYIEVFGKSSVATTLTTETMYIHAKETL
jgi:hypothetical protein